MTPSSFDVLAELFARDIDEALLRSSKAKTFAQRLEWLEEMQELARIAREAKKPKVP